MPRWPPSSFSPPRSTATGTTPSGHDSPQTDAVVRAQALCDPRRSGTHGRRPLPGPRRRSAQPRDKLPLVAQASHPELISWRWYQFYLADPDRLRAEVSKLLAAAPRAAPSGRPKAIIAPHAGYRYSGQIAAAAFATLEGSAKSIERVVLIGPAHYVPFRGITVPTVNAFATPLGRVPLNSDAHVAITALPRVQAADAPHAPEHALEVELPFLQVLL